MTARASALALASLLALAACRPDVESQVRCRTMGDLACPSGFHCGAGGTCVAGEGPPVVTFDGIADGDAISGRRALRFAATTPRGIALTKLEILRGQELLLSLDLTPTWPDDKHLRGTFDATFESWHLPDGEYTLKASVTALHPPIDPGAQSITFRIANGQPAIQLEVPEAAAIVFGAVPVTGRITSLVPLLSVTASLRQGSTVVDSVSVPGPVTGEPYDGGFATQVSAEAAAEGDATIAVEVVDAGGTKQSYDRHVVVHNGTLRVDTATATPIGPRHSGKVSVVYSEAPSDTPTITGPGVRFYSATSSADRRTYGWSVDLLDATADVVAKVTAHSATHETVEKDLTIAVDVTPPKPVGSVRLERRLGGTYLSLACTEPAHWKVQPRAGGGFAGVCDADRISGVVTGMAPDDVVTITDAVENDYVVGPDTIVDEDPYAFQLVAARAPGGVLAPGQLANRNPGAPTTPSLLASEDGQGVQVSARPGDASAPAFGRVGRLRRTAGRPVVLPRSASGALRFLLLEGAGTNGRITLYEVGADGAATALGALAADARIRPAFDAASGRIAYAVAGQVRTGPIFGPKENIGFVDMDANELGDTVICGGSFYVVGVDNNNGSVHAVRIPLSGIGLQELGRDMVPPAAASDIRLACREGFAAQLFAPDAGQMMVWESDSGTFAFNRKTSAGIPVARHGFLVSPDGLVGAGSTSMVLDDTSGYVRDLFHFDGNTWKQDGNGPLRRGGTLFRDGGTTWVVGGRGPNGPVALTASSTNGYAEAPLNGPTQPPDLRAGAWDFPSRKLVMLESAQSTSTLFEWTDAAGWTHPSTPFGPRHVGLVVARQDGTFYVTGGYGNTPGVPEASAFAWDGTRVTSAVAVSGIQQTATVLADGRLVVGPGDVGNGPATVVSRDLVTTTPLNGGPRMADVILATPGRDTIVWTTGVNLQQANVSGTVATVIGQQPTQVGGVALLPWIGAFASWPLNGIPQLTPLPSGSLGVQPTGVDGAVPGARTCFAGPPSTRRAACLLRADLEEPAVVELDDEAHPTLLFSPNGEGAGEVHLCARTKLGPTTSKDVSVIVYSGNDVLRPTGTDTATCRRFSFTFPAVPSATIAIVGNLVPNATDSATLDLDEFVALRSKPR